MSARARMLPDGDRLHLQHGPIDLVVQAWGAPAEVAAALGQARACFAGVLPGLCAELPRLRARVDDAPLPKPSILERSPPASACASRVDISSPSGRSCSISCAISGT